MYFLFIVYTTLLKNKIGLKKRPEHCTSVASLDSFIAETVISNPIRYAAHAFEVLGNDVFSSFFF